MAVLISQKKFLQNLPNPGLTTFPLRNMLLFISWYLINERKCNLLYSLLSGFNMAVKTLELHPTIPPVSVSTWKNAENILPDTSTSYPLPAANITYVDFYLHDRFVSTLFILAYLLIFIVCMVGNGVVCFIVLRGKDMHTVTNLFIFNLAISDLLVGIFCMPTTLVDNIITGK